MFHGVDQLKQLAAIDYLDERLALCLIANHINGRRVLNPHCVAQTLVFVDFGGELALGVNYEWQIHFVRGGKFLGVAAQVLRRNLRLVLET